MSFIQYFLFGRNHKKNVELDKTKKYFKISFGYPTRQSEESLTEKNFINKRTKML